MKILKIIRNLSIQVRIPVLNFLFISLVFFSLVWVVESSLSNLIEDKAVTDVHERTKVIAQLVDTSDKDLRTRISLLADVFKNSLTGDFLVESDRVSVGQTTAPTLKLDGVSLNSNFTIVDRFTELTGAVSTVFVRDGEDFIRITTSLKNEKNDRAVGTHLDRAHPGYKMVVQGKPYIGLATLFGRSYITKYDPIQDSKGAVVGLRFVGMDFTNYLNDLKNTIRQMVVGKTGYFYVLDVKEGATYGNLIVHPSLEGKNILKIEVPGGTEVFSNILKNKNGITRYEWPDESIGGGRLRSKVVAYSSLESWGWIIAGGTYVDEYTVEVKNSRLFLYGFGVLLVLLLSGFTALLINKWVSVPLREVQDAAKLLAKGDLRVSLTTNTSDEIGSVKESINTIGIGLSDVVLAVRSSANEILAASHDLAGENAELSRRTDSQLASLDLVASSMETLNSTVKQNADSAKEVRVLAAESSSIASESGSIVSKAVSTMSEIDGSSKRIADIVGVIDAIAFQTNILALNAAVEAARAGEHGRGFAVVASEVRTLAGRSATAASEIKGLIDVSQDKVTQGNTFVSQAGQTMTNVVNATSMVTRLVDKISSASSDQASSVEAVVRVVAELNDGTHENTLMVEEMSNASSLLNTKATELVNVVSVFQLNGDSRSDKI